MQWGDQRAARGHYMPGATKNPIRLDREKEGRLPFTKVTAEKVKIISLGKFGSSFRRSN